MRIETARLIGGSDFHRAKHGMGHERWETVVRMLKRYLQNVLVERAGAVGDAPPALEEGDSLRC